MHIWTQPHLNPSQRTRNSSIMMEPAHHKTNPCVSNRYTTEARDSPFLVYSIGTIQIQTRSAWTKGSSLDQDLDEKGISDAGTRQLQGHGKAKARWVGEQGLGYLQPFPHPTPPKHTIYYILLPPFKRFPLITPSLQPFPHIYSSYILSLIN